MSENTETINIGLNILLLSFSIPREHIKDNDDIRVSITTYPEKTKQHFRLHAKYIDHSNHNFRLNITNKTKMILFVIRKKSFILNDPVISCTTIHSSNFPKIPSNFDKTSDTISTDIKTFNLYEPIIREHNENEDENKQSSIEIKNNQVRKVKGQMQVQFTFSSPYAESELDTNDKKTQIGKHKNNKMVNRGFESHSNKIHHGKADDSYISIS